MCLNLTPRGCSILKALGLDFAKSLRAISARTSLTGVSPHMWESGDVNICSLLKVAVCCQGLSQWSPRTGAGSGD